MQDFLNFLILGLTRGSLYALIALGYTLVYGVLQLINFAHSEVFMSGAFGSYLVVNSVVDDGSRPPWYGVLARPPPRPRLRCGSSAPASPGASNGWPTDRCEDAGRPSWRS